MVELPMTPARSLKVGDCVNTINGRDAITTITQQPGQGAYTVVAMEELIVVNGIVASPFGGVNPAWGNIYYNLHRVVYSLWGNGNKPNPAMVTTMSYLNNVLSTLSLI